MQHSGTNVVEVMISTSCLTAVVVGYALRLAHPSYHASFQINFMEMTF